VRHLHPPVPLFGDQYRFAAVAEYARPGYLEEVEGEEDGEDEDEDNGKAG
jgi:hypothetical protein